MPSEPAPSFIAALDGLTARVRAFRVFKMGRLSDILAKASNAQAGLETAVEADVNKYVDRVQEIHKKREAVFLKKHTELDGTVTDLAQFETELDAFGKNDHSGDGKNSGNAYAGVNDATTSK